MPSTSLVDLDKRLMGRYLDLAKDFTAENPGEHLVVTCTYRSPEEQWVLYTRGRSEVDGVWMVQDNTKVVTQLSGKPGNRSLHNLKPAEAIDVAVTLGGKITWDYRAYLPLSGLAYKHNLEWGGDWPHLKDYPHLQLPQGERT